MPQADYERRLLERGHALRRWENQPAERYQLDNLDLNEVRRTLADAQACGRLEVPATDPLEALEKLKVVARGQVLQAAVVAYANEVLPDYPQCGLRMARFRGTTRNEFLDQRQLTGHAFQLFREAELFLRRHLPVRGRFAAGLMERQDEPLFPLLALREALVNALCHRDYAIYGGAVSVGIYDDRLEITSAGLLPFGLTVADLKRKHDSRPRNPLLANLFYLRGLIERWGRGTQRIVELCVQAGHPEPEFEELAGSVTVCFPVAGYTPPHRVEHNLTERQRRILHVLQDGTQKQFKEIRAQFNPPLAERTLRDDLTVLRTLGLVASAGRGQGARWWLRPQAPDE
jgi:ATP-dependent DNA helicase RecG